MSDTTIWREVVPTGGEVTYRMEGRGERLLSWYSVCLPHQVPGMVLTSSGMDASRFWCTWCDTDDCPHTRAVRVAQEQHHGTVGRR